MVPVLVEMLAVSCSSRCFVFPIRHLETYCMQLGGACDAIAKQNTEACLTIPKVADVVSRLGLVAPHT